MAVVLACHDQGSQSQVLSSPFQGAVPAEASFVANSETSGQGTSNWRRVLRQRPMGEPVRSDLAR